MIKRIWSWCMSTQRLTLIELAIAFGVGIMVGELTWYYFV